MKRFVRALGVAVVALAAIATSIDTTPPPVAQQHGVLASAGFRATLDSITGEFQDPDSPPEIPLSEDLLNAISTDTDGLVEEPADGADGGTMVRLNGRFKNIYVGRTDADGLAGAECISTPPKGAKAGEER